MALAETNIGIKKPHDLSPHIGSLSTRYAVGRVDGDSTTTGELVDKKGRRIINRATTKFDGAVSYGGGEREAVVVDAYSQPILELYQLARTELEDIRLKKPGNTTAQLTMLTSIVKSRFKNGREAADAINGAHRNDQDVPLSSYVREGSGVCRHMQLVAAVLGEKLIAAEVLPQGEMRVERNQIEGRGGHGWAVFVDMSGENAVETILDPSLGYCGPREGGKWTYRLPDE